MKIDENTTPLLTVDHLKQYLSGRNLRISRGIRFREIYDRKKYHPPV